LAVKLGQSFAQVHLMAGVLVLMILGGLVKPGGEFLPQVDRQGHRSVVAGHRLLDLRYPVTSPGRHGRAAQPVTADT
jgi:hypothetical protein